MYDFTYQRADSVDDAAAKVKGADDAMLMAGGMTLIPTLKQRLAQPSDVVDLSGITGLAGISVEGDTVVVGAMTTHATVAASADVKSKIPTNISQICKFFISLSKSNFFTGLFETALDDGEVVTAVKFPAPSKAAYMKFPNPASRYAIVGVFVAQGSDGVRVAVTGAGQDGVFRVSEMESALANNFSAGAVANIAIPDGDLNSDIHASSEYRAHLVTVMAKRAVDKAA